MEKVLITVCLGTTCHLMGSSHFQTLEKDLPSNLRKFVKIEYKRCLGLCSNKAQKTPYVVINDEIINEATIHNIIEKITSILNTDKG